VTRTSLKRVDEGESFVMTNKTLPIMSELKRSNLLSLHNIEVTIREGELTNHGRR